MLQTCASIHSDPSFLSIFGDKWLTTLTILTSLVSVIVTVTNTFLKMPHVYNEKKVPNTPYWKNYLVVGPLMLLVVTPRLILISIFFACCRYGVSVALIMIALVLYGIPFWTYAYAKFKTYGRETWKMILVNFATSIVGPCYQPNITIGHLFLSVFHVWVSSPIRVTLSVLSSMAFYVHLTYG